jgi:hypothetical protein
MRLLLACALLAACAHRVAPEDVVSAYVSALEHDDADAAYNLLSKETRREVSREQFVAHWHENRDAARADVAAIRTGAAQGAGQDARVVYADGLAVPVTRDAGGWRITDVPTPRTPHATTPEEAIDAFQKQLNARDYDAIAKVLSAATREAVERELRERTLPLKDAPPKVEIAGEKARVKLGRFELLLERGISGEWHVVGVK